MNRKRESGIFTLRAPDTCDHHTRLMHSTIINFMFVTAWFTVSHILTKSVHIYRNLIFTASSCLCCPRPTGSPASVLCVEKPRLCGNRFQPPGLAQPRAFLGDVATLGPSDAGTHTSHSGHCCLSKYRRGEPTSSTALETLHNIPLATILY